MTDVSVRPDPKAVFRQLKDFQQGTARYAFERLYDETDPTHRFLVADEVGLGKTLVAKGVISLVVDRLWDSTRRIDIIYICSNAAIARQNINRLNVTGTEEMNLASRITMLPVQVRDLSQRKLNFISFTPATSFDLRSSLGMMDERAVLHRLLEQVWGVAGAAPQNALRGMAGTERFRDLIRYYRDQDVDDDIARRFGAVLESRVQADKAVGQEDLRARWEKLCGLFSREGHRRNRPVEATNLQVQVVGELRDLLATTCLHALEPDLIILDEFQRFKHLLADDTEESRLARDLFNYSDHESQARVLLLSATPYKMFTVADEADGEDHYTDFLATIRFLQKDPARTARCAQILEEYRRQLLRFEPGNGAPLRALKTELESEFRRVMARTERLAVTPDRDGMLHQVATKPLEVTPDEATTYRGLGQMARLMEQADPVEYWKSSPYLLSFMEEYEIKRRFRRLVEDPGAAEGVGAVVRDCPQLTFPWNDYLAYGRVDAGNARMRWLQERFIDSGAWRLLWVPPSRPWYRLEGPFSDPALAGFTKLLLFSSWNVVPKAVAALTSYAAEREMMVLGGGTPQNTPEAREAASPILRFARDGGASLLALIYPSFALARMGAETERDTASGLPSRDDLLEVLETRIRAALRRFPDPTGGREDESWYWAAPALLDLLEDQAATNGWFKDADLRHRPGAADEDDEEGAGVFEEEHLPALEEKVGERGEKLGRRPADLARVLAQLALAGPAVAALRALTNLYGHQLDRTDPRIRGMAGQVAYAFRSYFNLPEVTSLLRGGRADVPYWRQVLSYSVDGGLGAVLEEYAHVLYEWLGVTGYSDVEAAREVADAMIEALTIRTANPGMDHIVPAAEGTGFTIEPRRMRSRFATRLGEDTFEGVSQRARTDHVRKAFNSPFWPFVMATTSVGQEGLDFHLYCHAVAHWNLPSNPVDLEQREGRVHRFKGHAVRKNVAASHAEAALVPLGADPWRAMFDAARAARPAGSSDLWPYWIYPIEGGARIERHVPLLPLSREVGRFARLRRSVTLYRMVFGQPRQEDLLEFLMTQLPPEEALRQAEDLRFDLTPPTAPTSDVG
jgi:hypothetical protein